MQKVEIDGAEVEVYTAEEHTAALEAAKTAVKGEYEPKVAELTGQLTEAQKAAAERSGQFKEFRKLSEEQVEKLSEAQKTIYQNTVLLAEKDAKIAEGAKISRDSAITAAIAAKVSDTKVAAEVRKMYDIIGLTDDTAEGIAARTTAALGALGANQPDLLASVGLGGGTFDVPAPRNDKKSFADTDAGKALAAELGLLTELPKK